MSHTIPVIELAMVTEREIEVPRLEISTPSDLAEVANWIIGDCPVEKLIAIMINGQNRITGVSLISKGGLHMCAVRVVDVMRPVLTHQAAAFALAHNHPSGNPSPSHQDTDFTAQIQTAFKPTGISMIDHVVVTLGGQWALV